MELGKDEEDIVQELRPIRSHRLSIIEHDQ